jgi:hypothetical protein
VAKTMAIKPVMLSDPWAVRDLTICVKSRDELPVYARQLVEHLRDQRSRGSEVRNREIG